MLEINRKTGKLGGWRYYQPETDTLIKGPHYDGLVNKVANHRLLTDSLLSLTGSKTL